jgi:uncharacterized protein (DUF1015 family)
MRYFLLSLVFVLQINNVAGNDVSIPQRMYLQKTLTIENPDRNIRTSLLWGNRRSPTNWTQPDTRASLYSA